MEKNSMEKKTYSKPCVGFVDFSLTGSIAATCVHKGNYDDGNSCSYYDNGYNVFSPGGSCDFPINKDFCYHAPTEDSSVFSS